MKTFIWGGVFAALLLLSSHLSAAILLVNPAALSASSARQNSITVNDWVDSAYRELHVALAMAQYGDQVWVKEGTYYTNYNYSFDVNTHQFYSYDSRAATFYLPDGVAMYGSFQGTETATSQRMMPSNTAPKSILSGYGTSYHVVVIFQADSTTLLDGFSVTGGIADSCDWFYSGNCYGGGIYHYASHATISNCWVYGNSAQSAGAGLWVEAGMNTKVKLLNCNFSNESSNVNVYANKITISHCTFYNVAEIYSDTSLIEASKFSSSSNNGLIISKGYVEIVNSIFCGNSLSGIRVQSWMTTTVSLTNCTITGNSTGITSCNTFLMLKNTVIWNNMSKYAAIPISQSIIGNSNTIISYDHSLVQDSTTTIMPGNNIDGISVAGIPNYPAFVKPFNPTIQ